MSEINIPFSFSGKKKELIENPQEDEEVNRFLKKLLLFPQVSSQNINKELIYNFVSDKQRLYYKEQKIQKQSFEDFKKEVLKIDSERVKNKVLFLFDNPLELTGHSFSCRKSGMLFYAPRLEVKRTGKAGYKSVLIKGYSFHPVVENCGKRMARIVGRFK